MARVRSLETTCATLARAGHGSGVWDYPWAVFQSAVEEFNEFVRANK